MSPGLRGVRVLVTRPAAQAQGLARAIREHGGEPVLFPTLAILPLEDPTALEARIHTLEQYDLAVFISPNAVRHGLEAVRARHGRLPPNLALAAVGRGTAAALRQAGYEDILIPMERADSEGLLARPELQAMGGRRVLIFRGQGGRETLKRVLTERGARVDYAECYRRGLPDTDPAPLRLWLEQGTLDIVTLTSGEAARNLVTLAGETHRARLLSLPQVVIGERIARLCRELGFEPPALIAADGSDAAMVDALRSWRLGQKRL